MALKQRESSHFYTQDGSPLYEIAMSSDPGKMRSFTLADAKKMMKRGDPAPFVSVTTVQGEIAKPLLVQWQIQQAIIAALANPARLDGESEEGHHQRIANAAYSIVDDAAKRGTLIHEAVERFVSYGEKTADPTIAHLMVPYYDWHNANVERIAYVEKTVIHRELGYAGRLDMKARIVGRGTCIIDFKTRKHDGQGKIAIYEDQGEQLRAYLEADATQNERADRTLSVIIASDTPDIHVAEWSVEKSNAFWEAWKHLLARWQILKGYKPV